jgi:hypothetical protein
MDQTGILENTPIRYVAQAAHRRKVPTPDLADGRNADPTPTNRKSDQQWQA